MNKGWILIVPFLLGGCLNKGADLSKVKVDSEMEKASYAVGYQIGQNMKHRSVEVDPMVMARAVDDVLKGKEPVLDDKARSEAMQYLQKAAMESQKKAAEKNTEEGKKFLEANKKKEGVKVTESGLQYKVVKEGTGAKPKDTDTVEVHYKGTLTNGEKFDSSYDRKRPAQFPVKGVIKGWTEALQLMKEGGKWELYIPSELAYGSSGRPGIPANSVLVFEVELLKVNPKKDSMMPKDKHHGHGHGHSHGKKGDMKKGDKKDGAKN